MTPSVLFVAADAGQLFFFYGLNVGAGSVEQSLFLVLTPQKQLPPHALFQGQ